MNLDLIDKSLDELKELLVGKTISVTDRAEDINVPRATVTEVSMLRFPAFWTNEGKICILDTDVGRITIWDTSKVELTP